MGQYYYRFKSFKFLHFSSYLYHICTIYITTTYEYIVIHCESNRNWLKTDYPKWAEVGVVHGRMQLVRSRKTNKAQNENTKTTIETTATTATTIRRYVNTCTHM